MVLTVHGSRWHLVLVLINQLLHEIHPPWQSSAAGALNSDALGMQTFRLELGPDSHLRLWVTDFLTARQLVCCVLADTSLDHDSEGKKASRHRGASILLQSLTGLVLAS